MKALTKTMTGLHIGIAMALSGLTEVRAKVNAKGEFGDLYEGAREALFDSFEAISSYTTLCDPPLDNEAQTICERDGATLHTRGTDVIHTTPNGKQVVIDDEHELEGQLGSVVVGKHEWTWGEMADGAIAVMQRILANAQHILAADRSPPPGHNWTDGPKYEAHAAGRGFVTRDVTICCRTCSTVAYWCDDDKIWCVDKNYLIYRDVKPTCAEEKAALADDLASRLALADGAAEDDLNDSVYELAAFVLRMHHPERDKRAIWNGVNFANVAKLIIRVLKTAASALNQLGPEATFDFALSDGQMIRGTTITTFIGQTTGSSLVVCPNGEVWSLKVTAGGPDDNPTISEEVGKQLDLSRASHEHMESLDQEGYWLAMPTAADVLRYVICGPYTAAQKAPLVNLLRPRALETAKKAVEASARGGDY